jgi:hypothetical protein
MRNWKLRTLYFVQDIRHIWKGNIKTGLREVGYEDLNMIKLSQDIVHWRVFVKTVMDLCCFIQRWYFEDY